MKPSPILVKVTDSRTGETIGHVSSAEFMRCTCSKRGVFLPDAIAAFNARNELVGEPERAESVIRR